MIRQASVIIILHLAIGSCRWFQCYDPMNQKPAGFREHEHTADWELEVWAPDMQGLLEQAARGMYTLSGVRLADMPRLERLVQISAYDAESLLVAFLQELLYIGEMEDFGFDLYDIQLEGHTLNARLHGSPIESLQKEIKAVTYHNIQVVETDDGVTVRIVFDV